MYLEILREKEGKDVQKMSICSKELLLNAEKIISNDKFVVTIKYDLMEKPFEFYLDVNDEKVINELSDIIKKDGKAILKVKDNGLPPLGHHRGLKIVRNDFVELARED